MSRASATSASRDKALHRARWLSDVMVPAWQQFWSLLFPTECVCCQLPDTSLCPACRLRLRRSTVRPFRAEDDAGSLPEDPAGLTLPVVAAGTYRRELSQSLLAYKNRGHTDLRSILSVVLAGALHHAVDELADGRPVMLIPVPSTAAARRRRGYEPVYSMLRSLQRRGLLPAYAQLFPALWVRPLWLRAVARPAGDGAPPREQLILQTFKKLLRGTAGQKGLGASARRTNVRDTMGIRWSSIPRGDGGSMRCLIVDDVLTTGATIAEAFRVLDRGGYPVIGAVVLAATTAPKDDVAAETARLFVPERREPK